MQKQSRQDMRNHIHPKKRKETLIWSTQSSTARVLWVDKHKSGRVFHTRTRTPNLIFLFSVALELERMATTQLAGWQVVRSEVVDEVTSGVKPSFRKPKVLDVKKTNQSTIVLDKTHNISPSSRLIFSSCAFAPSRTQLTECHGVVYTEYTFWSVHNTLFLVITWLRTLWLKSSQVKTFARHSHCPALILLHNVFVERPLSSVPSCVVLTFGSVLKTPCVYHRSCKKSVQQPTPARSLVWVWPNG